MTHAEVDAYIQKSHHSHLQSLMSSEDNGAIKFVVFISFTCWKIHIFPSGIFRRKHTLKFLTVFLKFYSTSLWPHHPDFIKIVEIVM